MSKDSLICIFLVILIPALMFGQEYPHQNDSKEQRINYRTTDQQPNTHDQAINNFFPLEKLTAGNGVWTELHPNIPRVGYWGVDFINADTGWTVGEAGAIIILEGPLNILLTKYGTDPRGQEEQASGTEDPIPAVASAAMENR